MENCESAENHKSAVYDEGEQCLSKRTIRTIMTTGVLRSTRPKLRGMIANPQGDPVHPTALGNNGRPELITDFDY